MNDRNQKIENIGTDDVAEGNVVIAGKAGGKADGKLRKTCSYGYYRKTDYYRRYLQQLRNGRSSVNKEIRTFDKQYKARYQQ